MEVLAAVTRSAVCSTGRKHGIGRTMSYSSHLLIDHRNTAAANTEEHSRQRLAILLSQRA